MQKSIVLLIKPVSGACNMRCRYCFYEDEMSLLQTPSRGVMHLDTAKAAVIKTLAYAKDSCCFAFQGGEPTLIGLPFFERFVSLVKQYNHRHLPVRFALQTNGLLLDESWAKFFVRHQFLIGLSLDGGKDQNDLYRLDDKGKGTYSRVLRAAQILKTHAVSFNILTVVTAQTAKSIGKIYPFFMRNGFVYQQYIPCLDPLGAPRGMQPYSLTPALYGDFLKKLFDLWALDRERGVFVYNRYFENLASILLGRPPESCDMVGQCAEQYVLEADGSVYPCDFYALDAYCLGSVLTEDFSAMDKKREEIAFIAPSRIKDEKCLACKWLALCRGGCRRHREETLGAPLSLNYYCPAFLEFFPYALPRLEKLVSHQS